MRNPTQAEIIAGLARQVLNLDLNQAPGLEVAISLGAQIEAHAGQAKAEAELAGMGPDQAGVAIREHVQQGTVHPAFTSMPEAWARICAEEFTFGDLPAADPAPAMEHSR